MRIRIATALVAVFAAGCWQLGTGPGTHAGGRQGLALQVGDSRYDGWTTGERLAHVVTATASGQVATTDANTRAAQVGGLNDRSFAAVGALGMAYTTCMSEGGDAYECGAPFVVEAAHGNTGVAYAPYGMAGGLPPRTVRAVTAVYGGYAPLGAPYSYAGSRRGGEAVDSVARSSVAELAGALREHTEGGGQ